MKPHTIILALLALCAFSLQPFSLSALSQTVAAKLPPLPPKPATANKTAADFDTLVDAYLDKYTRVADQAVAARDITILDNTKTQRQADFDALTNKAETIGETIAADQPWADYLQAKMMRIMALEETTRTLIYEAKGGAQLAPTFTEYPAQKDATTDAGFSAVLKATVKAYPAPDCQWQSSPDGKTWTDIHEDDRYFPNTQPYPDPTLTYTSLNISTAPVTLNGMKYRCVAKNTAGAATGETLTLTVKARPVAPAFINIGVKDTTVAAGSPATFKVTAQGNPEPTYQWQRMRKGSDWTDIANNDTYAGATTDTLTILKTDPAMNGDQFRCIATNPAGSDGASDRPATLTVK